jgi:Predicted hydrolases or acyltransferases (alpha/beta hydrolase superfamily)
MKDISRRAIVFAVMTPLLLHAQATSTLTDTSPHSISFVTVAQGVRLEVLDWGGAGKPLILLAGLGSDAHVFDQFAPKLASQYHVYGITRRGFGASSSPSTCCENYAADRLGDDVLAVMDALKINRPVLAGHSIAGEELSSIGTRFPEKISGLIYLEAGYPYAYYDLNAKYASANVIEIAALRKELDQAATPASVGEQKARIKHLLEVSLPKFEDVLHQAQLALADVPDATPAPPDTPALHINVAIMKGVNIYTGVKCPVLAIFAVPHNMGANTPSDPAKKAALIAKDQSQTSAQADAFLAGNPSAHVVRIANADHFVFRSNEAAVLREMNAFIADLP